MGIVGAVVISRWSWGLIQDTGGVLLDRVPDTGAVDAEVRTALETEADTLTDLHVWQVGPGSCAAIAAIAAVASAAPRPPAEYKDKLHGIDHVADLTVEVNEVPRDALV